MFSPTSLARDFNPWRGRGAGLYEIASTLSRAQPLGGLTVGLHETSVGLVELLRGFDVKWNVYDPYAAKRGLKDYPVKFVPLENLLKQAELLAEAAAPLKMWSIAEGIRTSAKIPRTLKYLSTMAPTMSDIELLRSLKAFDGKLMTADHKKASELVSDTARHISGRLGQMNLPLEEWAKILPYPKSPILRRLLDDRIFGSIRQ